MRKIIIIFLMSFAYIQFLHSNLNIDSFNLGCDLYKKMEYEKALEQFKSFSKKCSTANVFYNIGNTYFRLGKVGLALVYYERARRFSPLDNDVNFNIKFITNLINNTEYESVSGGLISKIDIFTIKLFFSISLFIFAIVVSTRLLIFHKRMFWLFIISFVFLLFFLAVYSVKYQQQKNTEAVIVSSIAEIRSGPDTNFKVNFTLPEGKKMTVLQVSGNWIEVEVKSLGVKGWLELENIEII
ncbi:MAG: SH3 domain-containing protein [Elusimicrobiota bacterium]